MYKNGEETVKYIDQTIYWCKKAQEDDQNKLEELLDIKGSCDSA